jgi:deazaflavin-dependent oxidoreductase (nitroreductase family)
LLTKYKNMEADLESTSAPVDLSCPTGGICVTRRKASRSIILAMKRTSFLYHLANRLTVWAIRLGIARPPYTRENALIVETVGRRSGRSRRVPVGYLQEDGKLMVVVEDGAQWVQNAFAQHGRLRVFLRGHWYAARLRPLDVDPEPYLVRMHPLHVTLLRRHSRG